MRSRRGPQTALLIQAAGSCAKFRCAQSRLTILSIDNLEQKSRTRFFETQVNGRGNISSQNKSMGGPRSVKACSGLAEVAREERCAS